MTDTTHPPTEPAGDPTPTQFQPGPPEPPAAFASKASTPNRNLPIAVGVALSVVALILAIIVFTGGDDSGAGAVEAASADPTQSGLERTVRAASRSALDGDIDGVLAAYADSCTAGIDRSTSETELRQGLALLAGFTGVAVDDIGVGDVVVTNFVEGQRATVSASFTGPDGAPLFPDDTETTEWEFTPDGWRQTTCDL